MNYFEMKKEHETELNNFEGLFFAFSNKQLNEGLLKIGLKETDKNLICSIGEGGFLKKDRVKAFNDMLDRQERDLTELKKQDDLLLEALTYELANHEYCITRDPENALSSLGLTIDTVKPEILKEAIKHQ